MSCAVDTPEQRDRCLHCQYYDCVDCIDSENRSGHEFGGVIYTIQHMADVTGRSEAAIRNRLKVGGVGFAMSKIRSWEEYKKNENIH